MYPKLFGRNGMLGGTINPLVTGGMVGRAVASGQNSLGGTLGETAGGLYGYGLAQNFGRRLKRGIGAKTIGKRLARGLLGLPLSLIGGMTAGWFGGKTGDRLIPLKFRPEGQKTAAFSNGSNHRALTAEIRKAKQIANGAGMVAINAMVATQDYAAAIRTAVEAGVDAVVSGAGLPLELPGLVNTMEVAIAPIVSSGRAAKLILRRWAKEFGRTADFVVIEGCKAGGHLGFAEQDLFSGTCQTLDEILPEVLAEVKPYEVQFGHSIPVFVAGGVYTGADLAHFTRLGAAGVQLATRFITTYECDASQGYKDVLLNAGSEDVRIIHSPVGMPGRALNTPLVQAMAEGRRFPPRHCARCLKTCDPAKVPYCITHALIEAVKGNLEEGLFFCGANVGRLDRMYTVRELMDELVTEWRQNR